MGEGATVVRNTRVPRRFLAWWISAESSVGCNGNRLLPCPPDLRRLARNGLKHRVSLRPTMVSLPSSSSPNPTIPKIRAGDGRIVVEFDPYRGHTFSQLSYTYPLKLLSPRSKEDSVAIVYVLSYGGGLVGGDEVSLDIGVREGASLMLLSQVQPLSYLWCGGHVWGNANHRRRSPIPLIGFHESFQGPVHDPLSYPGANGTA